MRIAVGIAGAGVGFAVGGPAGAKWGYAAGSFLGSLLFPASSPSAKTPQVTPSQMQIPTAQYGIPVPLIYGTRGDVTGNYIWWGNWQSHEVVQETEGGGGIGKGGGGSQETVVGFTYTVSFAIGLCMSENPRKKVIRAWRNKEEMSIGEFRQYDGSQLAADPHLASFVPRAPVYKNVCYVVFQDFDLGNQTSLPRLSFEISDSPACPTVNPTTYVSSNGGYVKGDMVYVNGYLFAPTWDTPVKIEKIDTADMTLDNTLVLDTGAQGGDTNLQYLGRAGEKKLWVVGAETLSGTDFIKFFRIDPDTLTVEKERFLGSVVLGTDGKKYIAFFDHVSGASTRPITGASWATFWREIPAGVAHDDVEAWVPGKQYNRIESLSTGGFTYSPRTDMMYFITDDGDLIEFDPVSIAVTRIETAIGILGVNEMRADSNFIYLAEQFANAELWKWDPVDMVLAANWVSPSWGSIMFALDAGFIYAMDNAGGGGLYKIDTADMTEVTNIPATEIGTQKDIFVAWGGIVVTDSLKTHRYALDDLAFVCSSTFESGNIAPSFGAYDEVGFYGDVFVNRDGVSGNPNNEVYKIESPAGNDVTPPDVSEDLLTSSLYGLGLDSGVLDAGEFNISRTYCNNNDLLVSMLFNTQISVLDILDYIAQHHNGYYRYYDGKIAHMQLQSTDASIATVTDLKIVKERRGLPVQGRVNVEYVKRRDQYAPGIAPAHDMLDRDKYGLKAETVKLDGFCTFERAAKMADLLLRKNLINARAYTFKLGPKSMPRKVGEIITLDYPEIEASNKDLRITAIGEGENGILQMTMIEEVPEIYQFRESGIDASVPAETPSVFGDAPSVLNPMAVELPALYSGPDSIVVITYEKPTSDAWAGATLFRSFNGIDGFEFIKSIQKSGLTGRVTAVGIDANDVRFIEVRLDGDDTLFSAVDFDSLMQTPRQNLSVFETSGGDIFARFQTATLQSARVWRLTGLIYDTVGFGMLNDYGIIRVNDKFATQQQMPFLYNVPEIEKHRTLFYKLASFNHRGEGQLLSEAIAFNEYIDALSDKPLSPFGVKANGIALDDTLTIKVPDGGGDVELEWSSRNRFNTGGYNYNRADAIPDDSDFLNFEMEIYRLTVLKRTITQTGKTFTYTAAMQTADSANTTMDFKLKQNGGSHTSDWLEFSLVFV
ncbi:MAG: phage tail protein [Planctomycetota bacterium]